MPILTKIPVASLPQNARTLAQELDSSRLVERDDGALRADAELGASEVRAALTNLTAFSPEEQGIIQQWAMLLGVETGAPLAPVKMEWQDREQMPKGKALSSSVAVGKHLYAVTSDQGYTNLQRFDPATDTWTEVPRPAQNVYHGYMKDPTLAEAGGQLYSIGGTLSGRRPHELGYRFDPAIKEWTRIKNNPNPRWAMGSAGHEGKLYVFGGSTKASTSGLWAAPFAAGRDLSNVAQVYDPASNSWAELPALPEARSNPGVIAHDGKIYVVGGLAADGNGRPKASRRVDVFDVAAGTWGEPMRIPTATSNPSLWLDNGLICVSGGHNQSQKGVKTIETLNPATGETGELAPVKFEEAKFVQLAQVDGKLLALGSADRGYKTQLKELAPLDPPPGDSVVNVITNNHTTNNTTNVNVDVTNIVNNISNTTVLNTLVDARETNITNNIDNSQTTVDVNQTNITNNIDNSQTNVDASTNTTVINNDIDNSTNNRFTFIDNSRTDISHTDVDILAPLNNFGFSDVDNNFFYRPSVRQQSLVQVGTGPDGQRYLTGMAHQGKGALPKNADCMLYDPAGQRAFRFSTDAEGQFACAIPDDLHGRVYLVRDGGGAPGSMAAPLDLP